MREQNAMHLPWLQCQSTGITAGNRVQNVSFLQLFTGTSFTFQVSANAPHTIKIRPERQLTFLPEPQSIAPKHSYSSLWENAGRICRTLQRSHRRQRPHSPLNHPRLYKKIPLPTEPEPALLASCHSLF